MESTNTTELMLDEKLSFDHFRQEVLKDFRLACESREASLLGRKEVLTGKAKFGIFGDGKEVPQVAMAKFFKKGDFYSGYYRDQTFAFATGAATVTEFFAQLYSNPDSDEFSFCHPLCRCARRVFRPCQPKKPGSRHGSNSRANAQSFRVCHGIKIVSYYSITKTVYPVF
jgi:hypothetical protein